MNWRKCTARSKLKPTNQEERIYLWKQHFKNLLGKSTQITNKSFTIIISNPVDIKPIQFTHEIDVLLRKIKNRKAAGLNEIPTEVWKARKFDYMLFRYSNAVYNQNIIDR